MNHGMSWFHWALLSACFAALTAIFAKLGLQRVDSDFATLIRTVVIVVLLAAFVAATGKLANPFALPPSTLGFLVLSALATGATSGVMRRTATRRFSRLAPSVFTLRYSSP